MKRIEEIRRDNARHLAERCGGTTAFAEKIDRSVSQVSRFLGPNPRVSLGAKLARHIEKHFKMPEGWLDQDYAADQDSVKEPLALYLATQQISKIPIISNLQAGEWVNASEHSKSDKDVQWIEISSDISADAFAIKMTGNSMSNPYGVPTLPNGSIAIVEPSDNKPVSGKIVLALLENSPETVIKKLEIDGPHKFLVPLNPKYDPIPINDNCKIIGFVKRVIIDL